VKCELRLTISCSLDVEGAEFDVIQSFPFEEYSIDVMSIERPSEALHL
jgi:hypothetical protein